MKHTETEFTAFENPAFNKTCQVLCEAIDDLKEANAELLKALKNLVAVSEYPYKEMQVYKDAQAAIQKATE